MGTIKVKITFEDDYEETFNITEDRAIEWTTIPKTFNMAQRIEVIRALRRLVPVLANTELSKIEIEKEE